MLRPVFCIIILILSSISLQAQNPEGKWRGVTNYSLKNGRTATHKMRLTIDASGKIVGEMSLEFGSMVFGDQFPVTGRLDLSTGQLRLSVAQLAEGPGIQVVMGPSIPKPGLPFISSVVYDVAITKEGDSLRISGPQSGSEKAEIIFPPGILIRLSHYDEPQEEIRLDVQLDRLPAQSPPVPQQPNPPVTSGNPAAELPPTPAPAPVIAPPPLPEPVPAFQKRADKVIRRIVADTNVVELEIYDNAEVDGDSITLFLDDQVVLAGRKISTQPIRQTIVLDDNKSSQMLRMYANNLGSIPPNTALMIVRIRDRKYEVFLSADLEKNAVIELKRKG